MKDKLKITAVISFPSESGSTLFDATCGTPGTSPDEPERPRAVDFVVVRSTMG
jgi:hypothetical protein